MVEFRSNYGKRRRERHGRMKITQDALISIYDAALSEKNWNRALDTCRSYMGANVALFYEFSTMEYVNYSLDKSCSNVASISDVLNEYNETVARGDGTNYDLEGIPNIHKADYCSVVQDNEIWLLNDAYRDRAEIKIPLKAGLFRRSFVNLSNDPANMKGIAFLYGREFDVALPTSKLSSASIFGPHVAKAAEIFRLTEGLRQKYRAVLSVLDQVRTGILVVSDKAEVVVSNRVANDLIEAKDGLRKTMAGQLSSDDEEAKLALFQAVAEASATAKGQNAQSGSVVQLPRRGQRAALVAVVSPLRDAEMEIEKGLAGALVTLIDPERPVTVQSDVIAAAYGLTKAEARVADLLLQGITNAEISDKIGVSPETIKSQISAVLAKSGCKSRASFIWRVFQLVPPIS